MQEGQPIHILSVEDNEVIRRCLRLFLKNIPGLELVAEATDAREALAKLDPESEKNGGASPLPDVALVDIGLPGMDGIELTKELKKSHPRLRVLMLTASENPGDIFASLEAGADGYVIKGDLSTNLEMAIRSVRLGAVWLDPRIARQVLQITQKAQTMTATRTLPTGMMPMPLSAEEQSVLNDVAQSNCEDGVCLVDPLFLEKLRRFSPSSEASTSRIGNK